MKNDIQECFSTGILSKSYAKESEDERPAKYQIFFL